MSFSLAHGAFVLAFLLAMFFPSICEGASASFPPQGPKVVAFEGGKEVWRLDANSVFEVRDFGVLKPVLVYNCAFMPAICNNILKYQGSLPTGGQTFYADYDLRRSRKTPKTRTDTRRNVVCPRDWIKQNKKANGDWRCPEPDQPAWTGYHRNGVKKGPFVALLSNKPKDGNPTNSYNRLATKETRVTVDENNLPTTETVWTERGAIMSCDEFPPASFIEGGAAGSGKAMASSYCAPIMKACTEGAGSSKTVVEDYLYADQDWQGIMHGRLRDWLNNLSILHAKSSITDANFKKYNIFRITLKTVNDPFSLHASWVEANGHKRYCFGPMLDSSGVNPGCDPELRTGEVV